MQATPHALDTCSGIRIWAAAFLMQADAVSLNRVATAGLAVRDGANYAQQMRSALAQSKPTPDISQFVSPSARQRRLLADFFASLAHAA